MALYPAAVKRLIPPGVNDPKIKARLVVLHVAATEADSLYGYFNGPSGGVESHFYIKYDGTVEQYRDTGWQADANMMANDFAISIETQGLANGTWTAQQLATIEALLTWCHTTHGIPLTVPKTWDGAGVGYHILFEDQWDQRHASCPGPNRIKQFTSVLVPWMAAGEPTTKEWFEMPLDAQAKQDITDAVIAALKTDGLVASPAKSNPTVAPVTGIANAGAWALQARDRISGLTAQVGALSAAVQALAESKGADAAEITAAVVAKINDLDLTLTPKEQS